MNKNIQVFVSPSYTYRNIEYQKIINNILKAGYSVCKHLDYSNIYLLIAPDKRNSSINIDLFNEINYIIHKKIPIFVIIVEEKGILSRADANNLIIDYMINFTQIHCLKPNIDFAIKTALDVYETDIIFNKDHEFYDMYYQKSAEAILACLLNSVESIYKIANYFSICKNFKVQSISHITANKCIVDPLGNPISDISNICIDVSEINDWMLNELNKNPTDLYKLSSRRFEELIAEILMRKGYKVELTPATQDGGKDIYAARKDDLGSFLYVVECKKYKPTHKIGVNILRDLYGVLSKERATYGIAVTTSYFSKPAKEFQQELQFQMSLKDFDSIKQWLREVT